MIKYLEKSIISETLHSVDKHNLKFWKYDCEKKIPQEVHDLMSGPFSNDVRGAYMNEVVNKPKLASYILKKIRHYGVKKTVLRLLVVLDDFAGHRLINRKETLSAKMMTKCRHYSCAFIIGVQTPKYVIKNVRKQAIDVVVWLGVNEEDFFE
jgi:hypothetical protein